MREYSCHYGSSLHSQPLDNAQQIPDIPDPFLLADFEGRPYLPLLLLPEDPIAVLSEISRHLVGQHLPAGTKSFRRRADFSLFEETFDVHTP